MNHWGKPSGVEAIKSIVAVILWLLISSIPAKLEAQSTKSDDAIQLIDADPVPEPFFTGAVPRTSAIAGDATLRDFSIVGDTVIAVGDRGVVCRSVDGGTNWTTQLVPFECSLQSVCFLTTEIGWIAGSSRLRDQQFPQAVLLQTRDGGETWSDLSARSEARIARASTIPTAELPGIRHVQFFGLDDALAITLPSSRANQSGAWRSNDGGESWSAIESSQPAGELLDAAFTSADEGIVVGAHQMHAALVSDQLVPINRPQGTLRAFRCAALNADGQGWIVGDATTVLQTDNGGITWQPSVADIPESLRQIFDPRAVAARDDVVLIAGNPASTILRSDSRGLSWAVHSLPASGQIGRLRFGTASRVFAIGSFGQILRSNDAGETWTAIRSAGFRSGLLNLVTNTDQVAWSMLATTTADAGVRAVVVQPSQSVPLEVARSGQVSEAELRGPVSNSALQSLSVNDCVTDWTFPRTRTELERSTERLAAEWNRQSDGQLRELLPLRVARDIRNWKPAVIVIEPSGQSDAVAKLLRDVLPRAIQLAQFDSAETQPLSAAGLSPWKVSRAVARAAENQTTPLVFRSDTLLPSLGTTPALLSNARDPADRFGASSSPAHAAASIYELLFDANDATAVSDLFEGLSAQLGADARRSVPARSRGSRDLEATLQQARLESAALQGQSRLTGSEISLIGELQHFAAELPPTLALRQLVELGDLHLAQNNAEGWLAIQQELARRFPQSREARQAAEMLFMFYSSAEARRYRVQTSRTDSSIDQVATENSKFEPIRQTPQTTTFASGASNATAALHERWDSHAITAWEILNARGMDEVAITIPAAVRLRQAANLRLQQQVSDHNSALADIARANDLPAIFAQSELQVVHSAATPALPLIHLPRFDEKPVLDGELSDPIWEQAEELALVPFVALSADRDSPEFAAQVSQLAADRSSLVMLAWDDHYLYLAARIERSSEQREAVQLVTHRQHDDPHDDRDRIELEIDTDRDLTTSFVLAVDESGRTSDRCWMLDRWNPKWHVAVDADARAWRVEAAIPINELAAVAPKPADLWSIKLRRVFPGVLEHEWRTPASPIQTRGTGLLRFVRSRRLTQPPR